MTHTNSNGEWINDDSKEVHTKVQERCSELLELGYMDEDKDKLTNTAFEEVVGVRSGYSRGLGAGIKPQKEKNVAGLHEELKKECEKRQDIEKKLKDVETQRQQELKMMEEMTAKIEESQSQLEESQRQLRENVDKQVEAKVATMLRQMLNIPGGESSNALDRKRFIDLSSSSLPHIISLISSSKPNGLASESLHRINFAACSSELGISNFPTSANGEIELI
ncbi:hypothetical protein P8452_25158 [Trifolium repens]|nr:hypothetical protein P8452_25158 [Trifolium repens]